MTISVPGGGWAIPLDIAVAACDHMGSTPITSFQQNSKVASRLNFRYDKRRLYELQRNLWTFSIREAVTRPADTTTMSVTFGVWDATKTYLAGSVATYNGRPYRALAPVPINQEPDLNPALWEEYFGPPVATPWAVATPQTTYWDGELVYFPVGVSPGVYMSVGNNNADTPNVVPAFALTTTYSTGQAVTGSDANVYQSKVDVNLGNDPTVDAGVHWALQSGIATQVDIPMGQNWLKLGLATASQLRILYPLGYGPASQTATKNIFPLPFGFIRPAPQDPKGGQLTWLGGPANNVMSDWTYENGFIVSSTVQPILLRFGADVNNVAAMDAMFCELFAAGLALDAVDTVTQAPEKFQEITAKYERWGKEARIRNAIVQGPIQSDEDEWISERR